MRGENAGKRVVLIDFSAPSNWPFVEALEEATNNKWETISCDNNRMHGNILLKLKRYVMYFILPFKIFLNRKKYLSVVAWQQFYGLILAFYLRVFHVKDFPQITVMTFIYKPKKGIIGKLYSSFMKYIVCSGYISKYIVFSKSEPTYYASLFGVKEEYFQPETLGIDDTLDRFKDIEQDEDLYLSPGRSNRDYNFLRKSWDSINHKLEIVCDEEKESNTDKITYNTDCHGEEYMKRLAKSHAVVIPLQNENISSGQLVMLQAMMLGKPVIVTKNKTVTDYIIDGYNGLIIEKTEEALIDAVTKLSGGRVYDTLCKNSRRLYEEKFSIYAMGLRIGKYL